MITRVLIALILLGMSVSQACAGLAWVSPNRCRIIVNVNMHAVNNRSNSPVALDIDPAQSLAVMNVSGAFDEDTIEVIGYNPSGQPVVFDALRSGYDRYLLPWRIDKYYGISRVTLNFVIPNSACTQYAVYFDTKESGLGKPTRYRGLVGDGDNIRQGYGRREINGSEHDSWCDLDGDGDLDLFRGAVEPFIFCHENMGGGRFVDRGRLTSGGSLLQFPVDSADGNRSWHTVTFVDWEGDGDQDLLVYFVAGLYGGQLIRYENTTLPGGPFNFTFRGAVTANGVGFTWASGLCFVDWDGDGDLDLLCGRDAHIEYHPNIGTRSNPVYGSGTYLQANGVPIRLYAACPDAVDIDNDGDLDLFVCTDPGKVYWFKNIGARGAPIFPQGRLMVSHDGGYEDARGRVKMADFDGDGLIDMIVGRYWERTHYGEQDRVFGRMYKNIGDAHNPRFTPVTAQNGAPYTETFQKCDAVMQNSVRAVDWNSDGLTDLISGDTDGFVWYFINLTGGRCPIFAEGVKIYADNKPLHVNGEEDRRTYAGYARPAVCDWNEDGKKDLLVASGGGWLWLYINIGSQQSPRFGPGERVYARSSPQSTVSHPIDGTSRSSVMVCDWNNDGKKDVIFAMSGEGNPSEFGEWPAQPINADRSWDAGFLFYKNIGANNAPVLAYPEWVKAGNPASTITYTRPTMGAFIDWNGDNVKDFIGSEFEHNVRVYFNTSGGGFDVMPAFTTSATGLKIVAPWTVQMMSSADAADLNGDGDIDIMTGQGHGASGLRFFERDYINDTTYGTSPTANAAGSGLGMGVRQAVGLADGTAVTITRGIVSAVFNGFFYIQSADRTGGIRVDMPGAAVSEGQVVDVTGTLGSKPGGERCLAGVSVTPSFIY